MSGPDHGDDDKGFLARWSQRKQEAKQPEPKPDAPAADASPPPEPVAEAEPEFDLSSLPKLEELTSTTDITGFLRKGVPEHLRNAALRKSWALDPAIRNYVNPAMEYAYDWNTPGGVPGSGELGAGIDVARMVLQIMGDQPAEKPPVADENSPDRPEPTADAAAALEPELPAEFPSGSLRLTNPAIPVQQDAVDVGNVDRVIRHVATDEPHDSAASQQPMRRHGSAKPTV